MDYTKLLNFILELFDHDYKYAEWSIVSEDILRDEYTPGEILDRLYELDKTNLAVLRGVAAHPNTSAKNLMIISLIHILVIPEEWEKTAR